MWTRSGPIQTPVETVRRLPGSLVSFLGPLGPLPWLEEVIVSTDEARLANSCLRLLLPGTLASLGRATWDILTSLSLKSSAMQWSSRWGQPHDKKPLASAQPRLRTTLNCHTS